MKISNKCIELVKLSEGFSSKPYLCPAGIPTIGYGSTRDTDGKPITMQHPPINEEWAISLCKANLLQFENDVNRYLQVEVTQGIFDALVDFSYNMGSNALKKSTLLRFINVGNFKRASDEFGKWIYADGKKLRGLAIRRERERTLFLS